MVDRPQRGNILWDEAAAALCTVAHNSLTQLLCHTCVPLCLQGCLAMKMLGWEDPFSSSICAIRAKEVSFAARMAQIKGLNLALQ